MKRSGYIALAAAVSILGCRTGYGPEGFSGGYNDYRAGRGVYYVSFSGNGFTSKSSVTQMWHRRCAEICGGATSYEIVSRDGSTSTDFYVSNGQLETVNKSFAEGYIRCVAESVRSTSSKPKKPKVSSEVAAARLATRKHPKFPELGMTPKESKALCKIQGGVQTLKMAAPRTTEDEALTTSTGVVTYSCRLGGILVYKATIAPEHQGFGSVIGYYEGADVDDVRSRLEARFGPPNAVTIYNGYRYWSWQDRIGVRAYDSGVKVIFKGAVSDNGVATAETSTNVYSEAPSTSVVDGTAPSNPAVE